MESEEEEDEGSALRILSVETYPDIEMNETSKDNKNDDEGSFKMKENKIDILQPAVRSIIEVNKSSENIKLSCNENELICHGYLGFQKDKFLKSNAKLSLENVVESKPKRRYVGVLSV